MLELSEQYYELEDKIDNAIDLINNNGGFTIVGWHKRGIINDRSVIMTMVISKIIQIIQKCRLRMES
jgi:hypothetical protein